MYKVDVTDMGASGPWLPTALQSFYTRLQYQTGW